MQAAKLFKSLWKPLMNSVRHYAYPKAFTHFIKNQGEVLVTTMENGMLVATDERAQTNASIALYLDAGSKYESGFEKGLVHFFEHIAFKSTRRRTKGDLHNQMMSTGGRFKCAASREVVSFNVECLTASIPLCIDILSDCVFNNGLLDPDMQCEANIIAQELEYQDTNTTDVLYNYLHATAFQKTSLADPVVGPLSTMSGFSAKTITQYLQKWFLPNRAALVVVGNISHAYVLHIVQKFINIPSLPRCMEYIPYRYTGSEVLYRDDSRSIADVMIAVEGPCYCHSDKLVMDAAAAIVGGWDKSQYGGNDVVYNIARAGSAENCLEAYKSFNITYRDTGLWGVRFRAPGLYLDDVVYFIQSEWMRLCNMITAAEVKRAQHEMKARLLTDTEVSSKKAKMIGLDLLYKGDWEPFHAQFTSIDSITFERVRAVCTQYIYNKCPVVVGVGPTEALPEYNRIRAGMYWLRV